MPRIPIYYGDHWESIYGVMLYPHDPEMARHHVAVHHLSVALAEMDLDTMRCMRKETPKRKKAGELRRGRESADGIDSHGWRRRSPAT